MSYIISSSALYECDFLKIYLFLNVVGAKALDNLILEKSVDGKGIAKQIRSNELVKLIVNGTLSVKNKLVRIQSVASDNISDSGVDFPARLDIASLERDITAALALNIEYPKLR